MVGELFGLSRASAHRDTSLFWFMGGCVGLVALFVAAACAFWFYPWSRATIDVSQQGVTLTVTGWRSRPKTASTWDEIASLEIWELPRGASVFGWKLRTGARISIRKAAVNADPITVVLAIQDKMQTCGYELDSPDLKAPVIGRRRWRVVPTQT